MLDPLQRRRLRWRSRRGLLENDVILTHFLDIHEENLSDEEVTAYSILIQMTDNDLMDVILDRKDYRLVDHGFYQHHLIPRVLQKIRQGSNYQQFKEQNPLPKAIFLDLDGTIIDTWKDLAHATNHVRSLENLSPLPLEDYKSQCSHGAAGMLKVGLNINPTDEKFQSYRQAFLDYYEQNIAVHSTFYPYFDVFLAWCRHENISWGIVTNKPIKYTHLLLNQITKPENWFEPSSIIGGDSTAYSKPNPLPLQTAIQQAFNFSDIAQIKQFSSSEILMVGDDIRDIQTALSCDVIGVAVTYGFGVDCEKWSAHHIINRIDDLILLGEKGNIN